jgi:hypothetical protein
MPAGSRWWDGVTWTGYVAPGGARWGPNPAPAQYQQERPMAVWAKAYAVAYVVFGLLAVPALIAVESSFRHVWHQYSNWIHASSNASARGLPAPPAPPLAFDLWWSVGLDVASLVLFGFAIAFYVWIYRAGIFARTLGYPSLRSPGWGVAVWMIPVVSLWMPAQTLRSLLPAGHPVRAKIWPAWGVYLLSIVLETSGMITAIWQPAVGWVLTGLGALCVVAVGILGFRCIGAVTEQHRQAVEAIG